MSLPLVLIIIGIALAFVWSTAFGALLVVIGALLLILDAAGTRR